VREQAELLVAALRRARSSTFRALTSDCDGTLVVIARFLALLELYRENLVSFEQVTPLGELNVRWIGPDDDFTVPDQIEEYDDADPVALKLIANQESEQHDHVD
jgi:segregation and condensation protein A